jgi:hypothetical protein
MTLCVAAAAGTLRLAVTAFTLAWTHSVEHVRWEEDWQLVPGGLELVEARIKGSGAGMDPPPDARLAGGWWVYAPHRAPQPDLVLAASGATGGGWTLCAAGACRELGAAAGAPIRLAPCAAED